MVRSSYRYFVVLIYVFFSGVMGVGWTNTFQGIFMLIIAWFLGIYLPYKMYGGIGPMFSEILQSDFADALTAPGRTASGEPWDWWGFSSAVIISALGFSMWPHFFMKAFAAKSDRTIKLTVVLYPTFQIFLVPHINYWVFCGSYFSRCKSSGFYPSTCVTEYGIACNSNRTSLRWHISSFNEFW